MVLSEMLLNLKKNSLLNLYLVNLSEWTINWWVNIWSSLLIVLSLLLDIKKFTTQLILSRGWKLFLSKEKLISSKKESVTIEKLVLWTTKNKELSILMLTSDQTRLRPIKLIIVFFYNVYCIEIFLALT